MDSDEELSLIGEPSFPVPNKTLRRLKKAISTSELCPGSETLDSKEADGEYLGMPELQSANGFHGVAEEDGKRSDLDDLGAEDGVTASKVLDSESVPEFNPAGEDLGEKDENGISDFATSEEIRDSETNGAGMERLVSETSTHEFNPASEELDEQGEEETHDLETGEEIGVSEIGKKRPVLETSDSEGNETKRNKKKKKNSIDFDELPVSTASMNMTKKERREYLDQLRAENQRLLRETRDAAFEPVPLVRKPISSVLEKIRRRKEEISKQFLSKKKSKPVDERDGRFREDGIDSEEVVEKEKNGDILTSKQDPGGDDCLEDSAGPPGNADIPSTKIAESNPTHQDSSLRSQTTNTGDEPLEKTSSRSTEEAMTPSILAMNLKLNPSPAPENSSQEAEYFKENSDTETPDSPGDPVRKFFDEVAEEEDDSDNDLLRFEDEDEGDDEEDDDLRDMIVSQFNEDPTDKDRRNELHQKWLEQQDAAGTEKLLQKLKRGLQKDEISLSEDEDEDADDEERADVEEVQNPEANEDEDEEEEEDPTHANSMRMTMKKIKEMIPLMFTDIDDVYVSSDEEEMEKKVLQQRSYKKMDLKAKLSSPIEDENSEEILRHINKPEITKKAKPSSYKDKTLMGIHKNPAASKSSFLGRLPKSSTSEGSRKRGSNIVRGYIFERDDSKSKSSNSVPEEPSAPAPETIVQEKSRPRRAPAKFTASQSQERSATSEATTVENETRTSLYEILKMSSKKNCFTSGERVINSSNTESIFASFKLDKKPEKR